MRTTHLRQLPFLDNGAQTVTPHGQKVSNFVEFHRQGGAVGNVTYEQQHFQGGLWWALPGSPNAADSTDAWTAHVYAIRFTVAGMAAGAGKKIVVTVKCFNEGDVDPGLTETTSAYAAPRIST